MLVVSCAGACVGDAGGACAVHGGADAGVVVGGADTGAAACGAGAAFGAAAAAAACGSVLVQREVGSRHDADVELGLWEGVCDIKRPAWNCVFQLKDKKI